MQSFEALLKEFTGKFANLTFKGHPESLYEPNNYFLSLGGKRVRPVMVLMGNDLFEQIHPDAYQVANAIELFHNFTLIHDDIMDNAPLRRGMTTVHEKYGSSTALLAGDVMFVAAYEQLAKIQPSLLPKILYLFNRTAREVCEGQQLDMDFEKMSTVTLQQYIEMITLKTSVLLAASLQMGAILGGAGEGNQKHIYEFGKNLGIAFQIQDDYLDAFGDPEKFGKQVGGDILANKKTFLLIQALSVVQGTDKKELELLLSSNPADKVQRVVELFKKSGVDQWALELKAKYYDTAMQHLEAIAVLQHRKEPLQGLANFLIQREY
ncbi:MAG: polyprenyl synthetase family protein [Chitinophagaceae bacterium]|uniref:polyprenyl synthetase family protein n=1 Tax=unclassified Paraflavitalea TaxID=2798305 RepID=UPI003D324887|nr:polyprenyl synthetase family protein [Chitinophagaceae bacterium]